MYHVIYKHIKWSLCESVFQYFNTIEKRVSSILLRSRENYWLEKYKMKSLVNRNGLYYNFDGGYRIVCISQNTV